MPPGHLVSVRKDVLFVGLGDNVHIPIQPANAHLAFQQGLADLPSTGGVIYVAPGTAAYVFQSTVVIDKPNVRIEFTSGPGESAGVPDSYLAFPTAGGPSSLFRVEAPRFTCLGAYVKHTATNLAGIDNGRSCFLLQPSQTQSPNGARFDRCRFDLTQESSDLLNFSAIRATGASDRSLLAGLHVTDCGFVIRSGTRSSAPTGSGDPRGVVGIRAQDVVQVVVDGLLVRGIPDTGERNMRCGSMILLDNCPASVLTDLVIRFVDLKSSQGDVADALIRLLAHLPGDGQRTVLSRLAIEDVGCRTAVELTDARSNVVSSANFGRLINVSESAIEVGGAASQDVVISAMNFHNVSQAGLSSPAFPFNHMIAISSARNVSLSGIVFFPFDGLQKLLRLAPGQCVNVVSSTALSSRTLS
jgi:hypothetical protein